MAWYGIVWHGNAWYRIVSFNFVSYHLISYRFVSYCIVYIASYCMYRIVSYHIVCIASYVLFILYVSYRIYCIVLYHMYCVILYLLHRFVSYLDNQQSTIADLEVLTLITTTPSAHWRLQFEQACKSKSRWSVTLNQIGFAFTGLVSYCSLPFQHLSSISMAAYGHSVLAATTRGGSSETWQRQCCLFPNNPLLFN